MLLALLLLARVPASVSHHPMLLHNETLLGTTWSRIARNHTSVAAALRRLEDEARGHLHAGPFTVTNTVALPPSGDKHDYVSIAVYFWPCSRTPGLGPCNLTACAHSACNCSSSEVCGRSGPRCNAQTGLPWQSCDGHENRKQIDTGGLPQLQGMDAAVTALSRAYYWTRNETYARRAVALIDIFFLAPDTRMNPNFDFAQSLGFPCQPPACPAPGVPAGSGSGLVEIDSAMANTLDNIALLTRPAPCRGPDQLPCAGSSAWTAGHDAQMVGWLQQWAAWMRASPFSTWACNFVNNHNAACRAHWLAVALWVNDSALAAALVRGAKEPQRSQVNGTSMPYQTIGLAPDCAGCDGACSGTCGKAPIGGQIDPSGFLVYEATRVNSVGYTVAELDNLFRLGQTARAWGVDLFAYTSMAGGHSSIRGALDFVTPFAIGQRQWPHRTETVSWNIFPQLRAAAVIFGNASYAGWSRSAGVGAGCRSVARLEDCSMSDAVLWWPDEDD